MNDDRPEMEIPGFAVEAVLGRGGMGVVYRVRRLRDDRVLALKRILRGQGASLPELARFRVEAAALSCLNHPNIIKIRDVGWHEGCPYFAMDYADGGSLQAVTARGPADPAWAAELARTVATAMHHAHQRKMLHRDLKPANVLMTADGRPLVTDFGLVKFAAPFRKVSLSFSTFSTSVLEMEMARFADELQADYGSADTARTDADPDGVTRTFWDHCATRTGLLGGESTALQDVRTFLEEATAGENAGGPAIGFDELTDDGSVMGSPSYMAPEQAVGRLDQIGPCTDIYAIGGILFELLTGRPPHQASNLLELLAQVRASRPVPPRTLVPAVPPALEAICLRCLEKEPSRRYPDAGALANDLARFLANPEAPPPDPPQPAATTGESPAGRTRTWWSRFRR